MTWNLLESSHIADKPLDLYERGGEFMIRVDGLELMSSLQYESESQLAKLAKASFGSSCPRILLGGLGLGFTLASLLQEFEDFEYLEVVEKSNGVLRWYNQYFRERIFTSAQQSQFRLMDLKIQLKCQDIIDYLLTSALLFDLILVDVDNGPEAICGESNSELYTKRGLELIAERLDKRGRLFLWSGFESAAFRDLAEDSGFKVQQHTVILPETRQKHYIYECLKLN